MPTPCVILWFARDGTSEEQWAAYRRLQTEIDPPDGRSMAISGGEVDELESVAGLIENLPFADYYGEAAVAAAKQKGLEQATFVGAIYFRERDDAPKTSRDISPVCFIGRFEFPFPERGDYVPRGEHGWLGIDEAYCLGEEEKSDNDDDYIGHS